MTKRIKNAERAVGRDGVRLISTFGYVFTEKEYYIIKAMIGIERRKPINFDEVLKHIGDIFESDHDNHFKFKDAIEYLERLNLTYNFDTDNFEMEEIEVTPDRL